VPLAPAAQAEVVLVERYRQFVRRHGIRLERGGQFGAHGAYVGVAIERRSEFGVPANGLRRSHEVLFWI
jgi:hypothetical protein